MKKTRLVYVLTALFLGIFCAENVSAQKKYVWNGEWNVSSSFEPARLTIKTLSGNKFKFHLDASNGANVGEISGVAKIKGNKAFFDDRESTAKDAPKEGCLLTFTNKGASIEVKQNEKCTHYAGNAVYFEGDYTKGKAQKLNDNFVKRKVFPNIKLDQKFKLLTGKDYQNFLDSFQLISPEEDLDGLGATGFSACVRGICPYYAGIIMFDAKGNLWAAVIFIDDKNKTFVNYYTNVSAWTDKMPKTLENWVDDKRSANDDLTVIFKNKK